jgi:hypothetical protein
LYPNPHNVRGLDDPDFNELIEREEVNVYLKIVEKFALKK